MVKRNVRRKTQARESVVGLIEEGFRCYERGNKVGAEKQLRAACAIRPPVPQAHYNLGYGSPVLLHRTTIPNSQGPGRPWARF